MSISKRKFYKSVITIEVLSEAPLPDGIDLDDIEYLITNGDCSGKVQMDCNHEILGPQCARLLEEHGSDPEFFQLTDRGEDMDEPQESRQ